MHFRILRNAYLFVDGVLNFENAYSGWGYNLKFGKMHINFEVRFGILEIAFLVWDGIYNFEKCIFSCGWGLEFWKMHIYLDGV